LIFLSVSAEELADFALQVTLKDSYGLAVTLGHNCLQVLFSQVIENLRWVFRVDSGELSRREDVSDSQLFVVQTALVDLLGDHSDDKAR